ALLLPDADRRRRPRHAVDGQPGERGRAREVTSGIAGRAAGDPSRVVAVVGRGLPAPGTLGGRPPGPCAPGPGLGLRGLLLALLPGRRRIALRNLACAFPELSEAERRRLCRRFHRHLGLTIIEVCIALGRPVATVLDQLTIEGRTHLAEAMAAHGRALML